jgi:hypothetical protein
LYRLPQAIRPKTTRNGRADQTTLVMSTFLGNLGNLSRNFNKSRLKTSQTGFGYTFDSTDDCTLSFVGPLRQGTTSPSQPQFLARLCNALQPPDGADMSGIGSEYRHI